MPRTSRFAQLQRTWRLGRVLGFPIDLKSSFLLLLALVFVAYGGLGGVLFVIVAFASVLAHELGHAVVARRLGVEIQDIQLGFLGGAARMTSMPKKANHEIMIAAAGPAVSLVLGAAGIGLGALTGSHFVTTLGWLNFVLAAFNLLPALPMDGGRILRAALTHRYTYVAATKKAITISRGFAIGFGILGLFGNFQMLLLAPFLWWMGTQELAMAAMVQDAYGGYPDDPDRELQRMAHGAWDRRRAARGQPPAFGGGMRRFTIRQVGGQVVIEAVD